LEISHERRSVEMEKTHEEHPIEMPVDSRIEFVDAGAVTFGVRNRRYSWREGVIIYALGRYEEDQFQFNVQPRTVEGRYGEQAKNIFSDGIYEGVEGKRLQFLRFEIFNKQPHYHYCHFPEGKEEEWNMDDTAEGDLISWTISRLRERLIPMLMRAEFPEVAREVDPQIVSTRLPQVEALARKIAQTKGS